MTSPKTIKTLTLGLAVSLAAIAFSPAAIASDATPVFASKSISNSKIRAGIQAFEKGDFTKAAFFQKTALKSGLSKSRKVAAYTNLCAAEAALGDLEAATSACATALQMAPDTWQAMNNQGVVIWLGGDYARAADRFAAAQSAAGSTSDLALKNAQLASAGKVASTN